MVEPFSVDSQLSMIIILSRAVELCWVNGGTGGAGVECLWESAVKISEIENKTAYIALCRSHNRQSKVIPNSELLVEQCTELCSCD